jgi:hypothetical protein
MRTTDPEFWAELTQNDSSGQDLPATDVTLPEDVEPSTCLEDDEVDDSDLSMNIVINSMITADIPAIVGIRKNGTLTSLADAENTSDELQHQLLVPTEPTVKDSSSNQDSEGSHVPNHRKKRERRANRHYLGFWRHYDEDDAKNEEME